MKKVVLIFPDTTSIAEFIVVNMVKNAEVNSTEQTLIAVLSSDQIAIACTKYGAILRTFVDV